MMLAEVANQGEAKRFLNLVKILLRCKMTCAHDAQGKLAATTEQRTST